MICDIATAVAAAVSDEVAPIEEGTGVETSDDDDEEPATDEGLEMRKPLTVSVWFRLELLLLLLLLLLLVLAVLLLLAETALLFGELTEDGDDDVAALDEASVCA